MSAPDALFSLADAYERFMGRWSRLLAPSLVNFAGIRDGDAVLDVGSGTGSLSFALRDATRAARIAGIDAAADYVSHAAQRNTDPRLRFAIGDALHLGFPDATFDKTLSMLVINFIPDAARAASEWMRVTRPGGTVAAAVWDYSDGMRMLRVFWDEAIAFDPAIARKDEAGMPLCKRGELGALFRRQGLSDVEEMPFTVRLHFASFDDYWSPFLLGQGPAGAYASKLPKDRQLELADRLRTRLLGKGADRSFDLEARAWAAKGIAPRQLA